MFQFRGSRSLRFLRCGSCSRDPVRLRQRSRTWRSRSQVFVPDSQGELVIEAREERNGLLHALEFAMLPVGYRQSMRAEYRPYVVNSVLQTIAVTVTRALSTQAMLLSIGLGKGAVPATIVTTWILKDGIGTFGAVLFGALVNTRFDADPRRFRWLAVVVGQLASVVSILSMTRPEWFLFFTSIGVTCSRISTSAHSATRARIYENFALAGNLGDAIRASQSQATFATLVGTLIGVGLGQFVGNGLAHTMLAYAPFGVATLFFAWRTIQFVELRTWNVQRGEILTVNWFERKAVLSPSEVAAKESVLRGYQSVFPTALAINPRVTSAKEANSIAESIRHRPDARYVLLSAEAGARLWYLEGCRAPERIEAHFRANALRAALAGGAAPDAALRAALAPDAGDWAEFFRALEAEWRVDVAYLEGESEPLEVDAGM